jgi:hypothetical protein
MEHRTYTEDDRYGVAYVMWFCRSCNVMVAGDLGKEAHTKRHEKLNVPFQPGYRV